MARDIVERLKETAIMLPRSGYVSVGHEATEAANEITALRARLNAVTEERNVQNDLRQIAEDAADDFRARAERAEAALATARRDAGLLNRIVLPMVEQRSREQHDAWDQAATAIRALANEAPE